MMSNHSAPARHASTGIAGSFEPSHHHIAVVTSSRDDWPENNDSQTARMSATTRAIRKPRRFSTIAGLVERANATVEGTKIFKVWIVLVFTLIIVNVLSYVIVDIGLFGGRPEPEWYELLPSTPDVGPPYNHLGVTDSSPTANLSDYGFNIYVGFIIYITLELAGLGGETLVWFIFLEGGWSEEHENVWRMVQFVFPLLGMTAIGLANTHNFWCLPTTVAFLWKFGFPETILYTYEAIFETRNSKLKRMTDLINGIGTVIHHNVVALYVSMVITGVIPPTRNTLEVTLPLLMQHWFVMLKYFHRTTYIAVELFLEAWFEWVALSNLEYAWYYSWTGSMLGGSMLFAHWAYLIAGGLSLINPKDDLRENKVRQLHQHSTEFRKMSRAVERNDNEDSAV